MDSSIDETLTFYGLDRPFSVITTRVLHAGAIAAGRDAVRTVFGVNQLAQLETLA